MPKVKQSKASKTKKSMAAKAKAKVSKAKKSKAFKPKKSKVTKPIKTSKASEVKESTKHKNMLRGEWNDKAKLRGDVIRHCAAFVATEDSASFAAVSHEWAYRMYWALCRRRCYLLALLGEQDEGVSQIVKVHVDKHKLFTDMLMQSPLGDSTLLSAAHMITDVSAWRVGAAVESINTSLLGYVEVFCILTRINVVFKDDRANTYRLGRLSQDHYITARSSEPPRYDTSKHTSRYNLCMQAHRNVQDCRERSPFKIYLKFPDNPKAEYYSGVELVNKLEQAWFRNVTFLRQRALDAHHFDFAEALTTGIPAAGDAAAAEAVAPDQPPGPL